MEKEKFNVFIVDDHSLFRTGLRSLLDKSGKCSVSGEAANGQEFLDTIGADPTAVVLIDIDMPEMDGMQAVSHALEIWPQMKFITLSMHADEHYYFKMVSLGVKGFLLKNSEMSEVLAAIETVATGGSYFSRELLTLLVGNLRTINDPGAHGEEYSQHLSQREREILLLICQGYSNQEIADHLFISKRTVDKHRANILFKTNCKNTANLVVYAIKNSLVEI